MKSEGETQPPETIESPGKYLKAKRESQRISLRQVANATRIREAVLRAIEEDLYEDLPHIYVKSFLTAYAKCLGLDPTDVIMLHQKYAEKLSFSKSQVLKHPSASRRKRVNVRLFIISISVALLIALIVYASFRLLY
jgi:cytoskeletal protein RodZ